MTKRIGLMLLCIIILMLPLSAIAGEVKVLTLQQALEIAADKNRDIQKAREYFRWVRGKYVTGCASCSSWRTTGLMSQAAWKPGMFRQ